MAVYAVHWHSNGNVQIVRSPDSVRNWKHRCGNFPFRCGSGGGGYIVSKECYKELHRVKRLNQLTPQKIQEIHGSFNAPNGWDV